MTQRDLKNALSGTGEEFKKKKKNDIVNTINPLAGTNRAREIASAHPTLHRYVRGYCKLRLQLQADASRNNET